MILPDGGFDKPSFYGGPLAPLPPLPP